jgi:hypothetical protein
MNILDSLSATVDSLLKIFIASRNDTDLTDKYTKGCHIEVGCSDNGDDIMKFVDSRLRQDRWCQRHMHGHVREHVLDTFRRKSSGMWVALSIILYCVWHRDV